MLDFTHIIEFLRRQRDLKRLLIAYSGGVDSQVLLHGLAQSRQQLAEAGKVLAAAHVNHGLQPDADYWSEHCRQECARLGVQFHAIKVDAGAGAGESPEAAARSARYRALGALLDKHTGLLTAQHQDDQAETLLYQLVRGGGVKGLAGMARTARLGEGVLLRPLLHYSRADITAYASRHGLRWVDDASNADTGYPRNYLRHEIIPLLQKRWPGVCATLARSAVHFAESAQLQDDLAGCDLAHVEDAAQNALVLSRLRSLGDYRQRNLVRYWLRKMGLPVPTAAQLKRLLQTTVHAGADRVPLSYWPGCEVRRYRDLLFAMPPLPCVDRSVCVAWSGAQPLALAGIGVVRLVAAETGGLDPAKLKRLSVRLRRGGEKIRLPGRRHRQTLKKLLQAGAVPPWQRERLPLLYAGEELAAVADLFVAEPFACGESGPGLLFSWQIGS